MEILPVHLPFPTTSLSVAQRPSAIRTKMDSGFVRQRRRFSVEHVGVGVDWSFDDFQMGMFEAFHKHKINLGADWFEMQVPLGGGNIRTHVVRLIDGIYSQQYEDVGYWKVSCDLEVQERHIYSEYILDKYAAEGMSVEVLAEIEAYNTGNLILLKRDLKNLAGMSFSRSGPATYIANDPTMFVYHVGDASLIFTRTGEATYKGNSRPAFIAAFNGQSNALAYNTQFFAVPSEIAAIDPAKVKIWNGLEFVGYVAGVNSEPINMYPLCWGPEAQFAIRWCEDHPDDTLYIVKCAIGATQLEEGGVIDWSPNSIGEHFDRMADFMRGAHDALNAMDLVPIVLLNFWMQGEMDAEHETGAAAYQANLTQLISESRSRWLMPDAKWIIGQVTYAAPYTSQIQDAQVTVAAADPKVYLLDNSDTPTDGVHYYYTGTILQGDRIYDILIGTYIEP